MLFTLKWSMAFLGSIVLSALGFRDRFSYTTQIIPKWKSDSEDLTPHGVYSAASLCDAYAICIVCHVIPFSEETAGTTEIAYFEAKDALAEHSL